MKQRCENYNHKDYKYYGGRGISVSKDWNKFETFVSDMAATYSRGLTLDRVANSEGYSKNNCRWADRRTQSRNTRLTVQITNPETKETQPLTVWAERFGINQRTIKSRIRIGHRDFKMLMAPNKAHRKQYRLTNFLSGKKENPRRQITRQVAD